MRPMRTLQRLNQTLHTLRNCQRCRRPSMLKEELVTKPLLCGVLYKKYASNEILIEGLDVSIHHSMREYRGGKQNENLHDLTFHRTSILKLQGHDLTFKRTNPTGSNPQKQRKSRDCTTQQAWTLWGRNIFWAHRLLQGAPWVRKCWQ